MYLEIFQRINIWKACNLDGNLQLYKIEQSNRTYDQNFNYGKAMFDKPKFKVWNIFGLFLVVIILGK